MTHIYTKDLSCKFDLLRGGERYVNVWWLPRAEVVKAGDRHWTREAADRAVDNAKFETPRPNCLYRVVVRFKPGRG